MKLFNEKEFKVHQETSSRRCLDATDKGHSYFFKRVKQHTSRSSSFSIRFLEKKKYKIKFNEDV